MIKKDKFLVGSSSGFLTLLLSALPTFAGNIFAPPTEYENLGRISWQSLFTGIIGVLLTAASVAAFIFLVIGGIRWIMAGGDKAAAESARSTITAAVIGLIIVFLVWGILSFIGDLFQVNIVGGNFALPSFTP